MSFLPESAFKLEMMDKAFTEKEEKESEEQGNWPRLYVSTVLHKTKHICIDRRVCLCVFHVDSVHEYRGIEPNFYFFYI